MAIFNYLTKDSEGNRKEGEIRADSLDGAIQKLSANGQMVISLKETDDTFDFLGPFLDEIQLSIEKAKNRIPLSNIVFFTRQLATMFSAGLTLERAIQSLGAEEKHRKFKKVLNSVSDNIRKGLNLSESLARHPGVFNTLFIAMVKAGEVSGNLNEILEQLSSYLENLDDTRRKVKSAMNYPIFMILFLIAMLMVMLLVIIPKFSQVYSQLGAGLPAATRQMIDLSNWFGANIGFLSFMIFLVFSSLWLISKTQRGGFALDTIKLKIPVFGALIEQSILNKFCKTFGILIGAGVPVLETTALLRKVVDNRVYAKAIDDASELIIGQTTNDSVSTHRVFKYADAPYYYYVEGDAEKKPVTNGIITCFNKKQAYERCGIIKSKKPNKGLEAAKALFSLIKNGSKKK